jgi:RNA polymerase sigma-70 factor (ECF subfamily)
MEPASEAPQDGPPDQHYIDQTLSGNPGGFDQLIHKYRGRVYSVIYNIVNHHEDAYDLTQEAFVRAYKSLGNFKGKSNFYTWLYRIAVNHAINFKKRRKEALSISLNEFGSDVEKERVFKELVVEEKASKEAILGELQEKLNDSLQKLSEEHRIVVVLHDVQRLPHGEIAKIMKCSEGTVRSRLHYAHLQLKSLLSNYLKQT